MSDHSNKELKEAGWNNRPDLIDLAIKHGADVNWITPVSMGISFNNKQKWRDK